MNRCKHPALPPVDPADAWLLKEIPAGVCPWCGAAKAAK